MPKSVVKAVVGRDGANLDEVAEATGCTVRDANGTMFDDKVLLLYGSGRDQLAAIERLWRLVAAGSQDARSSAPNSRRERRRPARRNRRPLPPCPLRIHQPPAPCQHLHVSRILISNRSSSRFDQFQLPMTSFVCSCHWPPNRFVTCARRSLRSQAT